jgi:hypothetical protein
VWWGCRARSDRSRSPSSSTATTPALGGGDAVECGHSCDLIGVERGRRHDDVGEPVTLGGGVQRAAGDRRDGEDADGPDGQRQGEDAGEDAARGTAELAEDGTSVPPRSVIDSIRPSIIATTRSASFASARSWVMKTTVVPW